MELILLKLEQAGRLQTITNDKTRDANRIAASRQFLTLLYARTCIFRVFLECASNMLGGITEDHKGHWLLIQLMPQALLGLPDVFSAFTQLVAGASIDDLRTTIQEELGRIRHLLATHSEQPALFCVLDEAQVPTSKLSDYFRSDNDAAQPRPILREIIRAWMHSIPNLIISGTGVSMQEMETVLGSVVAKEGPQPKTETDLGAFDNEQSQRAYLECYLPPNFLDSDAGKLVASRIGYWLHGRCVCNVCMATEC